MRDECPHCGTDLRICTNCRHYSEYAYNNCKEPQAERVVDKNRNNQCDYFELLSDRKTESKAVSKEEYLKQLDSLFK